jgi:hypothetical protein
VPRELNLARLRYYLSLACIATGVLLVLYVGLRQLDAGETATPSQPEAVVPPTLEPVVKAGPEDCPPDWRYLDNVDARYTVCLPLNLVGYDGSRTWLLEEAQPEDWFQLFSREFVLVNDAWLSGAVPADHPAIAPISLRIDVVPPTSGFDGCDLRAETPDADGAVACADRLHLVGDQVTFSAEGSVQRFRALIPTQRGKSVNEVFSLYLSINGYSANWELQEPLFRLILAGLRPY